MKKQVRKNSEHMMDYYEKIVKDERIELEHLNLFISIYYWWTQNKFQSPVAITSKSILNMSRLKSIATYQKCMKELHEYGYIKYFPSNHPDLGNMVYIMGEKSEESGVIQ